MRSMARSRARWNSSVIRVGLCLALLFVGGRSPAAEAYPTRTISLIVPYSAGTGIDIATRMIAEALQTQWKQPVIVENKVGASGNIGTGYVAKARPDGYTLLVAANTLAMSASLYHLPYDPLKSFSPITLLVKGAMVLAVNPSVAATSVAELIAFAKSKPGGLSYGSPGIGTPQHLAMELLQSLTGSEFTRIPYKGMGDALLGTLSGENQMMFAPIQSALPFLQDGKIKGLAVSSPSQNAILPALPPLATALGVAGFDVDLWYGLFAPAGTPDDILKALNAAIAGVLRNPGFETKLRVLALQGAAGQPEELAALLQSDTVRWAGVIKNASITAQ